MPDGEGSRWPTDEQYLKEAATKNGVEVISRSADNDENLQISQASELLKAGVDVLIVVSVNANTAGAIVREAHDFNVPVIAYDRLIKNSDLDYVITFEGAKIAELMVDHAVNKVPKGNYVMLWGDPGDVNAISIKEAQDEMLKPYIDRGDIKIVYKGFIDDWSRDNAYYMMSHILTFTDQKIDVVLTSYDGLALGALKAIKEHPDQDLKVLTGQDAELEALKAVDNGEMSLTIYKSIKNIANSALDLAIKLANNETISNVSSTVNNGRKDVPAIFLEPQGVDVNSIRSTVISDGYYTEEQVFE
ncbi:MAG: substrate-binding domain-containing protein [Prolixibacteraceae bacterium]|nr:substrate-binding domain-containing protein [Prolixibacteraceae bacterium]